MDRHQRRPSAATGTWSDVIYASLSPTLDGSAVLLGQFSYTSTLASGATYTQTEPVALPLCLSGNYYIWVVADISNRVNSTACVVNNQARSANPVTVNEGAYPDLVVNSVGIPNTAYAEQTMQVSWTVANAGAATANGPWLDSVYLSTSGTFSLNNSVLLGSYPYVGSLAPGAAYNQTASFTLPDTHGNFLCVCHDRQHQRRERMPGREQQCDCQRFGPQCSRHALPGPARHVCAGAGYCLRWGDHQRLLGGDQRGDRFDPRFHRLE